MKSTMLVNLERCTGCWTCAMACKVGHGLSDDEYRMIVRTLGNGKGVDRPSGIYPKLTMSWQPIYSKTCTWCAERDPNISGSTYCSYNCPCQALCFGDGSDPESEVSKEIIRLKEAGYSIFEMPVWENSKTNVYYAKKG